MISEVPDSSLGGMDSGYPLFRITFVSLINEILFSQLLGIYDEEGKRIYWNQEVTVGKFNLLACRSDIVLIYLLFKIKLSLLT